jgi:hypothetical protein
MRKLLMASLMVTVGCLPQLESKPSPHRVVGEYSYRIENKSHEPIVGMFAVLPDSVLLAPDREACWREQKPPADRYQTFRCQPPRAAMKSFFIHIDGNRPAGSSWRATQVVPRSRPVCAGSFVNELTGKMECVRWRDEVYFADSVFGGPLVVKQIAGRQ